MSDSVLASQRWNWADRDVAIRCAVKVLCVVAFLLCQSGCDWTGRIDRFTNPELLFDGGSLLFHLGSVDDEQWHLQYLPEDNYDTASADFHKRPNEFLLFKGKWQGPHAKGNTLKQGSTEEKRVLERLGLLQAETRRRQHQHESYASVLIELIKDRDAKRPREGVWRAGIR